MSDQFQHERYMRECFRLAEKGKGRVSPNPLVGAVLVRDGRIVARGYHQRFGGAHAEMNCLAHFTGDLRSATMYVNLEPCSHLGKTPPCADMLAASGIRHVVVGMQDPNPLVSGRGIKRLRDAGVNVTVDVLAADARDLNRMFVTHVKARRPYVHVKIAQSLDGYISSPTARRRWISSARSRALVHQWRSEYDAVLVGAGTIRKDNPRLDVRMVEGRDPAVVILDGRFKTSMNARALRGGRRVFLFVDRAHASARKLDRARALGIIVVPLKGQQGRLSMGAALRSLYRHGIGSVLVEGGADVFRQFVESRLTDELSLFLAPLVLGKGLPAFAGGYRDLSRVIPASKYQMSTSLVGGDIHLHAVRI